MADLSTDLCGLHLRNPILSASGTFGHGLEMAQLVPSEALGGWVSKTVTLTPRPGNPMPRTQETEAGFLNSIGLENRGLEALLREAFPIYSYDKTMCLEYVGYELGRARYTIEECRKLRMTHGYPFKVRLRLVKAEPVEEEEPETSNP